MLEDLEFQYLEEETEWLACREELHTEQKTLSKRIEEKCRHIEALETQGIDNQNTACVDTKLIEKDLWSLLNDLEKSREELKTIDTLLFELSGQKSTQSDSDDDFGSLKRKDKAMVVRNDIMSQSLFGSQEILAATKPKTTMPNLMTKSINDNLFFHKLEMPSFSRETERFGGFSESTPVKRTNDSSSTKSTVPPDYENDRDENIDPNDPLQKLKYNLSPPFDHKMSSLSEENQRKVNLNLSIESDDFEVNPLEKRVPSQDDIDRICKVTLDAPISMHGASYKVIESIKEIERNRQLLLAQQGSHVIEHERQKMNELKKKSHDEARAQYMQLHDGR